MTGFERVICVWLMEGQVDLFWQIIVSGGMLGSLYALVGLGFVLIYRSTRVVNFSQGEMLMLGAILALYFHADLNLPYGLAFVGSCVTVGLLGAFLERVAFRPLQRAPVITLILATVAVGQMIRSAVRIVRGSEVSHFPPLFPTTPFTVGGVTLTALTLGTVILSILLVGALVLFIRYTRIGRGMEAAAQNRDAATLSGVSINQTFLLTWAVSSALAAAAGILIAPLIVITPDMGIIGLKGFIGAILGGFLTIPGAIAGCFLLGIIENLAGYYISGAMKDVVSFVLLLLVLIVCPQGLFGRQEARRA
jgi:branched-chain amino acid transport system permease protein